MHVTSTFKGWMNHVHDDALKVAHMTGHMLHEKSFWGILGILVLLAVCFALLMVYGNDSIMEIHSAPLPYGGYF